VLGSIRITLEWLAASRKAAESSRLLNALHHTPNRGSIDVLVATTAAALSFQVRDTGCGMTQDEIDHAFERYQKGPESHGSGLGLAIARNLVLAHGGEIKAASQPGTGALITFTLPLRNSRTAASKDAALAPSV
jgi:signal transduction histidine kinase